ncbi:hypothetical protein [Polyangium mundeleinium]|uniref:Uncharacterized protein n=1 Tax=Polyangium mundeleinium TaxID=2995306 RepID=A0ABT5F620_9BACT|nr:hypothetical protein [Polyangium mundeleinium]MDC0748848.1 hypothetical protein [Polyangium mundeleinium]
MPLALSLHAHTPYALQPSSIQFRLRIENHGPAPVRGEKPDEMSLLTTDERGQWLPFLPRAPWPFPPEAIEIPPGGVHEMTVSSSVSGSMRDVGLYRASCRWGGAESNVVEYRVLGDRQSYVATLRVVSGKTVELTLDNRGPAPIIWGEPCDPEQDLSFWIHGQTRMKTVLTTGADLVRIVPGTPAVIRIELPENESGRILSGRFQREPFASGETKLVF